MIEAVNSVLANANLSRGSVEQTSNIAKVQLEAPNTPRAPFISPRIAVNLDVNQAVLQIRDSETGDVLTQFPSESRIRAIQAEQALQAAQTARQDSFSGLDSTSEVTAPPPVQNFDASALATLQAPQGVSTSDIQLAAVAFSSGASTTATSTASVSVTA